MEHKNAWTVHEIKILEKYYPIETSKEVLKRLPNRTLGSIRYMTKQLNLKKIDSWSDEEIQILTEIYKSTSLKSNFVSMIKEKLPNRTRESIKRKALKLGITHKNYSVEEKETLKEFYNKESLEDLVKRFPNRTTKALQDRASREQITKLGWTEADINLLKTNYKTKSLKELANDFGRTVVAISKKAQQLGLTKRLK